MSVTVWAAGQSDRAHLARGTALPARAACDHDHLPVMLTTTDPFTVWLHRPCKRCLAMWAKAEGVTLQVARGLLDPRRRSPQQVQ